MREIDNRVAEQMWYTWSDVGLGTVHAGFQIRAASPALTDIYSERVKRLERYMRYVLPAETDRFAITPAMAPICLAFLRTGQNEYILMQKKYVGRDGVGRLGNFFVHLLVLDEASDIDNTIALWKSVLWQDSDESLKENRNATTLRPVQVEALDREASKFRASYARVGKFLPFLLEAYLIRKDALSPLYIAAPASATDMIVNLIHALIYCLPLPLLKELTFSTYEPDVTSTTALIVGTSWIDTPGQSSQIFPRQFYQQHLALNCFTEEKSDLYHHPLTSSNPLATRFANYATRCLLSGDTNDLYMLREQAEQDPALTVSTFLAMFSDSILSSGDLSQQQIEYYVRNERLSSLKLSSSDFRRSLIRQVLADRGWWTARLQPALRSLCQKEAAVPQAALIAQGMRLPSSIPGAVPRKRRRTAMQDVQPVSRGAALLFLVQDAANRLVELRAGSQRVTPQDREILQVLLQLIESCTLPEKASEVGRELLHTLAGHTQARASLLSDWPSLLLLLRYCDTALSPQPIDAEAVRPFLVVTWRDLGAFLRLDLSQRHWEWVVMVVHNLAYDIPPLDEEAQLLQREYRKEINTLLHRLLNEPSRSLLLATFMTRLSEKGYTSKTYIRLQEGLLDSLLVTADKQSLLAAKDIVVALAMAGQIEQGPYPALVQQLVRALFLSNQEQAGRELIRLLVGRRYRHRADLLSVFLEAPKRSRLQDAFALIYLSAEEKAEFFLQYGNGYLTSFPMYFQDFFNLYRELLAFPNKMERLFILLDASLSAEDRIKVLKKADLKKKEEYVAFLNRYARRYLQDVSQPDLARYVLDYYGRLAKWRCVEKQELGFDLFQWARTEHRETILTLIGLSSYEGYIAFFKRFGKEKEYIPFFRQSPIVLNWFTLLSHYERAGGSSSMKMDLLLYWLDPVVIPGQDRAVSMSVDDEVSKLLGQAALTDSEKKRFLEALGKSYLPRCKFLPMLNDYVQRYIATLIVDDLDRVQAVELLDAIKMQLPSLNIEPEYAQRLFAWQTIKSYGTNPENTLERLTELIEALNLLRLQQNYVFMEWLAACFVECISEPQHLHTIMQLLAQKRMKGREQFLYTIAEKSAERHRDNIEELSIYLIFILEFICNKDLDCEHLLCVFLDILLQYVDVNAFSSWRWLHWCVDSRQNISGVRYLWDAYLEQLDLKKKVLAPMKRANRFSAWYQRFALWLKKVTPWLRFHEKGKL
jgi:hypothetical protein